MSVCIDGPLELGVDAERFRPDPNALLEGRRLRMGFEIPGGMSCVGFCEVTRTREVSDTDGFDTLEVAGD